MFLSRPTYDYSSQFSRAEENDLGPSLWEVARAGFRQVNAFDNTLSRRWNFSEALAKQAERVKSLTGEDLVLPDSDIQLQEWGFDGGASERYRQYEADGGSLSRSSWKEIDRAQQVTARLREIAARHPQHAQALLGMQSVDAEGYEIAKRRERRALETWDASDQGVLDWTASTLGSLAAGFTDPINVATMPLGPSGLVGTGIKGLALGALKTGGVNAAVELALQPTIQGYRSDAGVESGIEQAAMNVAMAFGMGAVIDTGVRLPQRGWAAFRGLEPKLDDKGRILGWGKPGQSDPFVPQDLIDKAEQHDAGAIREIAERTGMAERPDVRVALDEMDANAALSEVPPGARPETHSANVIQSLKHVADPDNEPMPVVRSVDDTPLPEMDSVIEMARYVRETRKGARPESLTEFLRRQGGLRDDGGDVSNMIGGRNRRPGLINKNGLDLDAATMRAWEAGFLPWAERPDINALLNALGEDLSGNRIIRQSDMEIGENLRIADDMEADLRELGFDSLDEGAIRRIYAERQGTGTGGAEIGARAYGQTPAERQALGALSRDAQQLITTQRVPADLGVLVGRFVADQAAHGRILRDLAQRTYEDAAEARAALSEMLRSPEYRKEPMQGDVRGPGKTKQLDDPYGAAAEAHIRELRDELLPEQAYVSQTEPNTVVIDVPFAVNATDTINGLTALVKKRLQQGMAVRISEKTIDSVRSKLTKELAWLPRDSHAAAVSKATPNGDGTVSLEMLDLRTNESLTIRGEFAIDEFLGLRALHAPASIVSSNESAVVFTPLSLAGVSDRSLAGQAYHEAVHLGKSRGLISEDVFLRLVDHARNLRVMNMQLGTFLRVAEDPSWRNADDKTLAFEYARLYRKRPNRMDLLDEEGVAHFVELYHHGFWSAEEAAPVQDILDDFFSGRMWEDEGLDASGDMMAAVRSLADRNNAIAIDDLEPDINAPHPDLPILAFHGTTTTFSRFDLARSSDVGHHFGTAAQANDRASLDSVQFSEMRGVENPSGRVLPVVLDIKRPMTMNDLGNWKPEAMMKTMVRQGMAFADAEVEAITGGRGYDERAAYDIIRAKLNEAGYDGIRYRNMHEGLPDNLFETDDMTGAEAAAQWSYITWKAGSVRSATDPDHVMFGIRRQQMGLDDMLKDYRVKGKSPAPPLPKETDALGYYSAALEAAKGLKQAKGTPEQMIAQIEKGAGVKRGEIEATGLREAFAGQKSVTREELIRHLRDNRVRPREVRYEGQIDANWFEYSLDQMNPTQRETVIHLPERPPPAEILERQKNAIPNLHVVLNRLSWNDPEYARLSAEYDQQVADAKTLRKQNFEAEHWSEPNVIGHARTSMHDDGKGGKTFLIGELQSDWSQTLRDNQREAASQGLFGRSHDKLTDAEKADVRRVIKEEPERFPIVRNEAKIAELKHLLGVAQDELDAVMAKAPKGDPLEQVPFGYDRPVPPAARAIYDRVQLLGAELRTAEAAIPGNPLVNTTDQWVNTMMRRMLRQAVDDGATSIAIPSGKTVDGYGMGAPLKGIEYAYDQMYPKNMRNILKEIDPEAAKSVQQPTLRLSDGTQGGQGFTIFPITDKVRNEFRRGMPLFAFGGRLAAGADKLRAYDKTDQGSKSKLKNLEEIDKKISSMTKARISVSGEMDLIRVPGLYDVTYFLVKKGQNLVDRRGNYTELLGRFVVKGAQRFDASGVEVTNAAIFDEINQRKGLGTLIYDVIDRDFAEFGGVVPSPRDQLSDAAKEFWQKRLGSGVRDPAVSPNLMAAFRAREASESSIRQQALADLQNDITDIEKNMAAGNYTDRDRIVQQRGRLLTGKAEIKVLEEIANYRDERGRADPARAWLYLHESHGDGIGQDVAHLADSIMMDILRRLAEPMWQWRKGALLGDKRRQWNPALATNLENVVRELYGQATGDAQAAAFAKSIADVLEYVRQRANAAGADIGKLKFYAGPQFHNADAWAFAGRQKVVDYLINDAKVVIYDDAGAPLAPGELRRVLNEIYGTVLSGGADKREVGQGQGKGALYKRRSESRVIYFPDADAWLKYNRDYGSGDIYGAMMGEFRSISQDIASMERFGANPELLRARARDHILNDAANQRVVDSLFDELSGQVNDLARTLDQATQATAAGYLTRLEAIHKEIDGYRSKPTWRAIIDGLAGKNNDKIRDRVDALQTEMDQIHGDLRTLLHAPAATPEQLAQFSRVSATMTDIEQQDLYMVTSRDPKQRAQRYIDKADKIWKLYTGATNVPQRDGWANGMAGLRNIINATTLIFTPFSALSDQSTQLAARAFNGMPATKQLRSFLRGFSNADRRAALQLGLGAEFVMPSFSQQARYVGQVDTRSITGLIADRSHAFSFLSPMTSASKIGFRFDFGAMMGQRIGKSFDELEAPFQRMLKRHGFSEAEWNSVLSNITPEKIRRGMQSLDMMTAKSIIDSTGDIDLAERFTTMMVREGQFSTIESTLTARAMWVSDSQPGTLIGELLRFVASLKMFPTTYMMLILGRHYRELLAGRLLTTTAAASAAAIVFGGMFFGAMAIQGKHMAQGRDPEDITTAKFWGAAFMQSGGLGIFGDFIYNSTNRHGSSLAGNILGPAADRVANAFDLTIGNVVQYGRDEPTNFGRELTKFARMNTPGMLVPWYVRTAYQRMVLDELQKLVDPVHHRSFRSQMQFYRKNNQQAYWPPGSPLPQRAPNLGEAVPLN